MVNCGALGCGLRTSLDLTASKNDAQATYGVTVDPSFQQVMAAVPPRPPRRCDRSARSQCGYAQHVDINTTRKHYIVPSIERPHAALPSNARRQAKEVDRKEGENGIAWVIGL